MAKSPRANFIDRQVLAKLRQLRLQPSARCTDEVFVRRVFLDTIGRLPDPDDVRRFLADIRALTSVDDWSMICLPRSDYVDFWTHKFSDLLLVNGRRLRPDAVNGLLRVDSRARREQYAMGPDGAGDSHGQGQQFAERCNELLCLAPRSRGNERKTSVRRFWDCRLAVPSATIIRWKSGPMTNTTRWPTSFHA